MSPLDILLEVCLEGAGVLVERELALERAGSRVLILLKSEGRSVESEAL